MHGLYLLWWVQEKYVPVAVVAALLAAGDLAITALEIPTGWFADRCGHRVSLIAGSVTQVAGMVLCWLGEGVPGLLSAILLVALGDTLRSGADQALLYRSCLALDRESQFQRIESRSRSLQLVALVAFILAGGGIVTSWGFAAGWIAETAVSAVGLLVALAMIEPPAFACRDEAKLRRGRQAVADRADLSSEGGAGLCDECSADLRDVRSARPQGLGSYFALIAPASLLAAVSTATIFSAQTSDTDPERLTMLVAGITLAEAIGSAMAGRLAATINRLMLLAAFGAAATFVGVTAPGAFVPVVITLSLLAGVAQPLRATAIQRVVSDRVRARAASVASACDKAVTTIALLTVGSLPRRRH